MIQNAAVWIAGGAGAVAVVSATGVGLLWRRVAGLSAAQRVLLPSGASGDLLARQHELHASVNALADSLRDLSARFDAQARATEAELARAIRFQGLIRYDAYRDMGGQQSWSLALLNSSRTGTVITCLHARDHARVYLKEVVEGNSDQRLSPEELRAVGHAFES